VFAEQEARTLGPFFTKEYLSRSLGIWDFDRDGRPDWYVTHLDHPLSILQNESTSQSNWIMIELIGVASERDAIGAQVRVRCGDEEWVHQRLAGNGFECSNEPWIFLGVANATQVDSVEIQWPSGGTTRADALAVNRRLRFVESSDTPTEDVLVRNAP
jgi:hypothetical protein